LRNTAQRITIGKGHLNKKIEEAEQVVNDASEKHALSAFRAMGNPGDNIARFYNLLEDFMRARRIPIPTSFQTDTPNIREAMHLISTSKDKSRLLHGQAPEV
jgi:hypothetical protein